MLPKARDRSRKLETKSLPAYGFDWNLTRVAMAPILPRGLLVGKDLKSRSMTKSRDDVIFFQRVAGTACHGAA